MNDKRKKTKEWIYLADHDLGSAKIIFQYLPKYFETIAFHCQQSIEKYIKSLLFFYDIEFKKTHDLIFLLELLALKIEITSDLYEEALSIEGFGVEIRYPNHKIYLTEEELKTTIMIAEKFCELVKKNIDFEIGDIEFPPDQFYK